MSEINLCLSCDDGYAKYAGVMIASVLANADKDDWLKIFILDGGISEIHKQKILSLKSIKDCEITFVTVPVELFEDYAKIHTHSYITIATYYRLKLSSILPNINKIIYLDCDMIVNASLKALFNTNLQNYLIAGVSDISKKRVKKQPDYINAGMIVFNLDLIKSEHIEDKFLIYTKENIGKIKSGDQDIINGVCKNRIKVINAEWNVQSSNFTNRSSYTNNPKIIHFVGRKKPWHWASFSYHRNLYFKYLQLTSWKLNINEYKKWTKDNQIASLIGYFKYRPLFLFRPRFYEALFKTYLVSVFEPKKPVIKENTFVVWEPCSKSHSEVVPGYVKYLLDLGYHVSVIVNNDRIKEGLFERFQDKNITLNKMKKKDVIEYFSKSDLSDVAGVLVTTVGKLCDEIHFDDAYKYFSPQVDKSKIFFVSHEAKHALDNGTWREKNITLRKINYKNGKSIVVNPHYFGTTNIKQKNDKTNFIMIGAIKSYKKDDNTIIQAATELIEQGITNFKITVIGKGRIKNIPDKIRGYFDLKGQLPFNKMYDELEKADFLLTAYNPSKPEHIRYNTTGTSGNFQLVYGFMLPCVIIEEFAMINQFNEQNSVIYKTSKDYSIAMKKCIDMSVNDYKIMKNNLKETAQKIYSESFNNLRELING